MESSVRVQTDVRVVWSKSLFLSAEGGAPAGLE